MRLVAMVVIAVIAAIALNKLLPKTYSVTNSLRIGQFMGIPLELPEFTKQRFKMVGFLADAYEEADVDLDIARDDYPRTVKVSIENDFNKQHGIDTIIFSTRGNSPEQAIAMSNAVSNHLIKIHGKKLKEARAIRNQEIAEWDTGITDTKSKIEELEGMLSKSKSDNINQGALYILTSQFQEQREIMFHMMQIRNNVKLQMSNPVQSFNTQIASTVRPPEKPSFPKLSILIPGLVFAAALFWSFLCWVELFWQDRPASLKES